MLNRFLCALVRLCIRLRYRVRVEGLRKPAKTRDRAVLILPNHPAMIDPVILLSHLFPRFEPRVLADRDQIDRFVIRRLARRIGVLPLPAIGLHGASVREEVYRRLEQCEEVLRTGGNLMLYPSGHLDRSARVDLHTSSGVKRILSKLPNVRVVLVRTTGLWGSSFSWASGRPPDVAQCVKWGIRCLVLNGLFFTPRRAVTIELVEPDDFPREAGRDRINQYLQGFYNQNLLPNTYVPYTIWERGRERKMPEPFSGAGPGEEPSGPVKARAGAARQRDEVDLAGDRTG